jgi:hypothetical protein
MSWATEADVVALTGTPADAVKLAQAQAAVELYLGRTEALGSAEMSARDLDWLRRGVAYQAAWMASQPDLFTRLEVEQLAQDGMSTVFAPDGLVLAPLARRVLLRLSWMGGTQSITVEPPAFARSAGP